MTTTCDHIDFLRLYVNTIWRHDLKKKIIHVTTTCGHIDVSRFQVITTCGHILYFLHFMWPQLVFTYIFLEICDHNLWSHISLTNFSCDHSLWSCVIYFHFMWPQLGVAYSATTTYVSIYSFGDMWWQMWSHISLKFFYVTTTCGHIYLPNIYVTTTCVHLYFQEISDHNLWSHISLAKFLCDHSLWSYVIYLHFMWPQLVVTYHFWKIFCYHNFCSHIFFRRYVTTNRGHISPWTFFYVTTSCGHIFFWETCDHNLWSHIIL